jgi:ATP-dependent Clp protease ATP-binding subunit ClpC
MSQAIATLLVLVALTIAVVLFRRWRSAARSATTVKAPPTPTASIYDVAGRLSSFFEETSQPTDLLGNKDFRQGVEVLGGSEVSVDDVLAYVAGDNNIISCLASEALRERQEKGDAPVRVIEALGGISGWPLFFALRYLADAVAADHALVGRVLACARKHWDYRFAWQFLRDFLRQRITGGEKPTFGRHLEGISSETMKSLRSILKHLGPEAGGLREEFERFRRERIDVDFLSSFGTIYKADAGESTSIIDHDALRDAVVELESYYIADRRRSVLLVGEPGVGKTTIARSLATRLHEKGWTVFEAGAADLVAGQVYIGQFEERFQRLLHQLSGARRILWVIPDFPALALAGRHKYSNVGALDLLLPHLEQGSITVLGESRPGTFERLALDKPRCLTALNARRIEPMNEASTLNLVRLLMERFYPDPSSKSLNEAIIREAFQLAQQFLGHKSTPGSVVELLRRTHERLVAGADLQEMRVPMRTDDLIVTLSQLTGLPSHILDDRQALDLKRLRRLFGDRVKGQPEAVDCLIDRVAMIKAGVTDPTRPSGVFLFAGPTGTGKTEIAKTLTEFLFGSPNRMIRLDMSEFQAVDCLDRILGTVELEGGAALVDQVRKQPFSVILLDEFEKAHERVWDVFLQVFDDGRLTDRRGNAADFRHSIIVLTSNLGGVIPSGLSLGFSKEYEGFRAGSVTRAIEKSFRKEFLNRIDRVVVFRPLSREVMRQILQKELTAAFGRRGLRSRAWAVEWDESAVDFLLARGFTEDLGARPLKRAIERYLLSPLAVTIVNRQFPEGDQFLFITGRGEQLEMEFFDPNALPEAEAAGHATEPPPLGFRRDLGLRTIAHQSLGEPEEIMLLRVELDRIRGVVDSTNWKQEKARALVDTNRPEFWMSPQRFETLGRYEYQDRIESGVQRASSLFERLVGSPRNPSDRYPRKLVGTLAHSLYLLGTACADLEEGRPREAFLLVESKSDRGVSHPDTERFAAELGKMYCSWALNRRMRSEVLHQASPDSRQPYRLLMSVSGFGAYSILAPEAGLHVLEQPQDRPRRFEKCKVQVSVIPQPLEPVEDNPRALRTQAEQAIKECRTSNFRVVRRYRRHPSPLVRDLVRHWRTGRLDQVLEGNFDLLDGAPECADVSST